MKKDSVPEWEKFSKMFNWIARSKVLSAFEKLLYTRLRGHLGNNTKAWPGMKTLASELGSSASQVAKGLKHLENLRLISVIRRYGRSRKMLSNEYGFPAHTMMYESSEESSACEDPLFTRESTPIHLGGYPYSPGRIPPIHPAGTEETHNKRFSEETQGRDSNQSRGSLRSPLAVSLRSSASAVALTKEQFPHHESDFTNKRGFAAESTFPMNFSLAVVAETSDAMPTPEETRRLQAVISQAQAKNRAAIDVRTTRRAAKERGLKNLRGGVVSTGVGATLKRLESMWMTEFKQKFPNELIANRWEGKERGQMKALVKLYSEDDVGRALRYYIRYWESHRPRFFKGTAVLPTLGQLRAMHATLLPEAKMMFTALKAKMDYDGWCKANPSATSAPDDLQASYDAARPSLKTLGL